MQRSTRMMQHGALGEATVLLRHCPCPHCGGALRPLRRGHPILDVTCACGFVASIKAATILRPDVRLWSLTGSTWVSARTGRGMKRWIAEHGFVPLFIVSLYKGAAVCVDYVPAAAQTLDVHHVRRPMSATSTEPGWVGFTLDLRRLPAGLPITLWRAPVEGAGEVAA